MEEIPVIAVDDLEDGEIESDGETAETEPPVSEITEESRILNTSDEPIIIVEADQPKEGKKKKSKSKGEKGNKLKSKNKKIKPSPVEDDFAGNIEKAIRKVLKNEDDVTDEVEVEQDAEEEPEKNRKSKKRKKHDGKDGSSKKKRKRHMSNEVYDDDMMCIRGASPAHRGVSPYDRYHSDDHDSYNSDSSYDEPRNHHPRPFRNKPHRDFKDRKNNKNNRERGRQNIHPKQDPDGICLYYMQGKCHKGDDCAFSHAAEPPRKFELCKFYLMDCCAKRDKCLYLHGDFPCKYYHTGLPCVYKDDCKFAHGKPLTDNLKAILLKHIESAPKEILGEFPRLSREGAAMMVNNTQMRLMQQYSPGSEAGDKNLPSIFEANLRRPNDEKQNVNNQFLNKNSAKVRQSRWQQESTIPNLVGNAPPLNPLAAPDVLNIKNLTGVLTSQQISDLTKLGIENLNQLSQLTVIQLNHLGLTLKQINEIQLNTMSIQKLGLIDTGEAPNAASNFPSALPGSMDLDMRVAPIAPIVAANTVSSPSEIIGKDVDMRFHSALPTVDFNNSKKTHDKENKSSNDPRINKDSIDIDQYTKDALKFATKEKENIDNMSTSNIEETERTLPNITDSISKDVDQRVLQYANDVPVNDDEFTSKFGTDTDIRFLQPDPKRPAKRHRLSTTDEEDNNLLIDEKWYSSDEEKLSKPKQSPRPTTPPTQPPVIEPTAVLSKLGDLSKIDISDEVTKLLTTMKNNLQENKEKQASPSSDHFKPRDPRSLPKKSPEHKSSVVDLPKISHRRSSKISIYDCVEGQPTDGRRRSDVDLRQLDQDFRLPALGDTDLRQPSASDIDFRLGLPFKPLPNYTPATEIEGSINSHPPIVWKVRVVDIPRPNYTDIKNSTAKSQAMADPRLRKLFRLSTEEPTSDSEKTVKASIAPRADPRRKPKENENVEQKSSSLELQTIIQNSVWYKELSTNQKIFVNQQLAIVTNLIKKYQQEHVPGKRFDLSQIQTNPVLCSIFNNLGVCLDENGEYSYMNKSQDNLMKPSMNYNQNSDMFSNNLNPVLDSNNLGMLNVPQIPMGSMGPVSNLNMNPMGGYNAPFANTDPRNAPGLLGIAPNMSHSFDNPNYGPPNFMSEGFPGNMPYNGSGNDFGNMDGDQGYHRNQGRGSYRGGGNERWNRGGGNFHGNRDRRNFKERGGNGGWKNDRR